MADRLSITDAAPAYLSAGLCALSAIRAEKRPAVGRWKQYQTRMPTPAELSAWLAGNPDAVCILCGRASGNIEAIDFDAGGELFSAWWDRVPADLRDRLVIEITPSGGRHVIYRCIAAVSGNLKLAQRKDGEKIVTLIETRGEGGLILCAPTAGYEIVQGDLCDPPRLTEAQRDILLQAAWELNEYPPPVVDGPKGPRDIGHSGPLSADSSNNPPLSAHQANNPPISAHSADSAPISADNSHSRPTPPENADRPGDDFNNRGDVRAVLDNHGWVRVKGGQNEYWRRPGKTSGTSATLKDSVFYVFSSNAAPFEPNGAYSPFSVYAMLDHGGDYEQAARCLRECGFGGDCATDNANAVDISAIVGVAAACASNNSHNGGMSADNSHKCDCPSDNGPSIHRLKGLIDNFDGLNAPVIHGLLREGETMNIIASPKMGKSWFVSALAISIASGLDWLGLPVEQGRVLHIDNELHACTSAYRYGVISEAMGMPHRLYSENIDVVSLRGQLRDLYSMGSLFDQDAAGRYKLVIIDAFYRTLPRDTDENDNAAIASLYNRIDHYAAQLQCAFVLIHHSSKGSQSGKAVTDVGAGAGSQSRAADTHLILRPHQDDDIIVLESAIRSWPPMSPLALAWEWPLFKPTEEVDASALLGSAKPKTKPRDIALEDFIDQCIGISDPCSQRSVSYEAGRQYGLPERQADRMLDLAIERGLATKIRIGSYMRYVKNRPGITGDKALWTAALLAHDPDGDTSEIAKTVGATRQYVNQIRRSVFGNWVETDGN